MRKLVIALGLLAVELWLLVMFGYPFVFGLAKGMFENSDIGTLVGIVACAMVTGSVISIGFFLAALGAVFIEELLENKSRR